MKYLIDLFVNSQRVLKRHDAECADLAAAWAAAPADTDMTALRGRIARALKVTADRFEDCEHARRAYWEERARVGITELEQLACAKLAEIESLMRASGNWSPGRDVDLMRHIAFQGRSPHVLNTSRLPPTEPVSTPGFDAASDI